MLHLMKLCVGADSVEDLTGWIASQAGRWPAGRSVHVTRMWPRRADEVLAGGSLYWVVKGAVLCRQTILALTPVTGEDGTPRCAIEMDARVIRTRAVPRRPFQGWRYLPAAEAPPDLICARAREDALPAGLAEAMAGFGLR